MVLKLGVAIEDTWSFFNEIYDEFREFHDVTLFSPKNYSLPVLNGIFNEHLYKQSFSSFLKDNDIVFFEWASGLLAYATQLPKTCGVVTRLHRYELYQWADKIDWGMVDKIILVSEAKKAEFQNKYPEQTSKIVVVPEAIAVEKYHLSEKPYRGDIGILCHLTPRKRVYETILAFYELQKMGGNFHLHIGGGPKPRFMDYYYALHDLAKMLNIGDRVTFYGNVKDPRSWFQNIDIFISNSYSEGLQVAPIEAMASGCYCLCHRWGGADELVPEANLYFTDGELVSLIREYDSLPAQDKKYIRKLLREHVCNRFDMNVIKKKIRQIVEDVAGNY